MLFVPAPETPNAIDARRSGSDQHQTILYTPVKRNQRLCHSKLQTLNPTFCWNPVFCLTPAGKAAELQPARLADAILALAVLTVELEGLGLLWEQLYGFSAGLMVQSGFWWSLGFQVLWRCLRKERLRTPNPKPLNPKP